MKWLIASDIHGGAACCRKLLERFEEEKADRLLLLGDILYHGPRNALPEDYQTQSVYEQLNAYAEKILCVRGNCDAEIDLMVLDFPMAEDYIPLHDSGLWIVASHGHRYDEYHLPALPQIDAVLLGHTHVPVCRNMGRFWLMNPGSVTLPKDGSEKGYMTLENGLFSWKTLDGKTWRTHEIKPHQA